MTITRRFSQFANHLGCATALLILAAVTPAVETASSLWASYVANPNAHPNIPNCSYAGYRYGEVPLPTVKVVVSVKDTGAKGDGNGDDTAAFAAAIAKAAAAKGGAVLVPAGRYRIEGMIRLNADGVVLRGDGPDKSVLLFPHPLNDVIERMPAGKDSQWGWSGGLVWIGPADTFGADGRVVVVRGIEGWEPWRGQQRLAEVQQPAKRGDVVVEVDSEGAAKLRPGMLVLMSWTNPGDHSLLIAMAGNALMKDYPWDAKGGGLTSRPAWRWPVEIDKVDGVKVTLRQPLRVDVRPEWKVGFETIGPVISEVGVENLCIAMLGRKPVPHLQDPGYNGIYLNRAVNCWVKDVTITDCDNGLIHAAAKNTTVSGLTIAGGQHHHATALRVGSHDNLITDFTITSQPRHGINTEALSTGNVWRRGTMAHGTFDSHRAMSFELIRTDITITNDGRPGGADSAGPFLGARVVHWNVRLSGKPEFVNQPDCISDGALVGIQGPAHSIDKAWAMVPGDKNCLIVDEGRKPEPADLYEAQLKLRLKR